MCKTKEISGFRSILELITYFDTEEKCADYLAYQRWGDNPVCPHCGHEKVYTLKGKNKRYKCASCRKQFSVRVGTIFEDSKIELKKWFTAIWLVTSHKKGISSLQLHRDINVTQKSAWFMLQRIRYALSYDFTDSLDGEVEADETYVGGKNKNRHANKKVPNSQGRSAKDKTAVVGMVERGGLLTASTVENVKSETLTREVVKNVKDSATLYTDEWLGYNGLKRIYDHSIVKHNQGQYVNGRVHTNTIEGFWSLLKRGIFGIYHFTSKKHLQKYVDEFVFRYNTRQISDSFRFQFYLSNCQGRLSYQDLIKV
jgi:transposase-like protein